MIGGIFGVLGQAQQQAEAQKQKNLESENEMNRMMMMSGYRPQADPSATQGGAPQQGIMEMLGQNYGKPDPYQFDPSQYAFDPNSPQGQKLSLEQAALDESIASRKSGDSFTQQNLDLDTQRFNAAETQQAWDNTESARRFSYERGDKLKEMSLDKREFEFKKEQFRIERDLKEQGIEIAHMNATANGYRFINDGGQFITIDILNKDENGNPTMTVEELPTTASESQRSALIKVRTLSTIKSEPFFDELPDEQKKQFDDLITTTLDYIVTGEGFWDEDEGVPSTSEGKDVPLAKETPTEPDPAINTPKKYGKESYEALKIPGFMDALDNLVDADMSRFATKNKMHMTSDDALNRLYAAAFKKHQGDWFKYKKQITDDYNKKAK